jgi:enoyl-CoA hydratase/carnithine racemase
MDFTELIYKEQGEIAYITFNRPEKMNAFSVTMLNELRRCFQRLYENKKVRIVVVKGEGKAWSAGVDLSLFQHTKLEPGYKIYEDSLVLIDALESLPQVTIAAVNGFTFTGAMELMMVFDLIVAADEAKIGDTHAKWGIPPKWGMTQRLQRQVGLRKAKELSFTAEAISGKEAERIGLVNQSVPLAELDTAVKSLANKILKNSKEGIQAIKHLYQHGNNLQLPEAIQYERDYKMLVTDKVDDLKNFKDNI